MKILSKEFKQGNHRDKRMNGVSQGSYLLFGSIVRAVLISASAFSSSDVLRYAWDLLYRALTLNGSCSITWYKEKSKGIHMIKLKHFP